MDELINQHEKQDKRLRYCLKLQVVNARAMTEEVKEKPQNLSMDEENIKSNRLSQDEAHESDKSLIRFNKGLDIEYKEITDMLAKQEETSIRTKGKKRHPLNINMLISKFRKIKFESPAQRQQNSVNVTPFQHVEIPQKMIEQMAESLLNPANQNSNKNDTIINMVKGRAFFLNLGDTNFLSSNREKSENPIDLPSILEDHQIRKRKVFYPQQRHKVDEPIKQSTSLESKRLLKSNDKSKQQSNDRYKQSFISKQNTPRQTGVSFKEGKQFALRLQIPNNSIRNVSPKKLESPLNQPMILPVNQSRYKVQTLNDYQNNCEQKTQCSPPKNGEKYVQLYVTEVNSPEASSRASERQENSFADYGGINNPYIFQSPQSRNSFIFRQKKRNTCEQIVSGCKEILKGSKINQIGVPDYFNEDKFQQVLLSNEQKYRIETEFSPTWLDLLIQKKKDNETIQFEKYHKILNTFRNEHSVIRDQLEKSKALLGQSQKGAILIKSLKKNRKLFNNSLA